MTEIGVKPEELKTKKGVKNFQYLKQQYRPHRETTEKLLAELGYKPEEHRMLKTAMAKKDLIKSAEAERDELTELLSRKGFARRFREELDRARRLETVSTLVFLDANGLKEINDIKGHEEGDSLLRKIASAIKAETRITDIASRLGGDEFAVLLTGTDLTGTVDWWERTNKRFEEERISISAGSREIRPKEIKKGEMELFIRNADARMYEAKLESKKEGRNILKN